MAAGTFAKATPDPENILGKWRAMQATYTGNAAYTAGGDAVPGLGLRSVRGVIMLGQNTASIGVVPVYNTQTGKLQLFQQASGAGAFAEFSGNASTFVYSLLIISIDD